MMMVMMIVWQAVVAGGRGHVWPINFRAKFIHIHTHAHLIYSSKLIIDCARWWWWSPRKISIIITSPARAGAPDFHSIMSRCCFIMMMIVQMAMTRWWCNIHTVWSWSCLIDLTSSSMSITWHYMRVGVCVIMFHDHFESWRCQSLFVCGCWAEAQGLCEPSSSSSLHDDDDHHYLIEEREREKTWEIAISPSSSGSLSWYMHWIALGDGWMLKRRQQARMMKIDHLPLRMKPKRESEMKESIKSLS